MAAARRAARCKGLLLEWTLHNFSREAVLVVRLEGDHEPEVARRFLQALGSACRTHSPQAVLIDRRRSALKFGTMSIYAHPEDYRQAGIVPPITIALVVAAITRDERFLENVFLNQGYRMQTFDDWRGAVAWVRGRRRSA